MGLGVEIKDVSYIFNSFSWKKREKLEVNMAKCLHMLNMDGGMFVCFLIHNYAPPPQR